MSNPVHIKYPGDELDDFARAKNWKKYTSGLMCPFIRGNVLECGAGLGSNTTFLTHSGCSDWLCLEPDPAHVEVLKRKSAHGELPGICRVQQGILQDLKDEERFDTLIYYDVLEHIEDDKAELLNAANHLRPGGHLIILAPAHPSLFSSFDKSIGHYRRYTKASLLSVIPPGIKPLKLRYLDSCGFLAYKAFGLFLNNSSPSKTSLLAWDRLLVPLSRVLDRIFRYRLGKSVVGVFKKIEE